MSRAYSAGKRDREAASARKRKEKEWKRDEKKRRGPREIPIVSAEVVTGNLDLAEAAVRRRQASASKGAKGIPSRLFVGGLAFETTADELRAAFSPFGPVTDAIIVFDRGTGRSRGFGFVVMESHKDTGKAIDGMNGKELMGRTLVVNVAAERQR